MTAARSEPIKCEDLSLQECTDYADAIERGDWRPARGEEQG
jgi:hypothetical protein